MRRLISLLLCGAALGAAPVQARELTAAETTRCRAIGDAALAEIDVYISAGDAGVFSEEDVAQAREVREALVKTYIPLFANAPVPDATVKAQLAGMSLSDLLDEGTACMKTYADLE